jgi:hypothetical protein
MFGTIKKRQWGYNHTNLTGLKDKKVNGTYYAGEAAHKKH